MFANRTTNGLNNLCGKNIALYRHNNKLSQRELADALQLSGLDVGKNAIQRIECGKRFVTDIELAYFSKVLGVSLYDLLQPLDQE
ncbi:MAG: helix-turn-helix transcriptional regulator [Clostridia bacterium]|nr:helix-turn-helix transcriptional regulator [Clostridia bacterium]